MSPEFLRAEWRKLVIANYSVDPQLLLPYLPYGTELDLWSERCYISLVGFMFLNTRLKGFRIPFHSDFPEVNLRFYVRYRNGNELKRGVSFIREIVPKPALSFVANMVYGENYVTFPMRYDWRADDHGLSVQYRWKCRGTWNTMSVDAEPLALDMKEASEEEFITEHYWGYTKLRDRARSEYRVEHPRWRTYPVRSYSINVDFAKVYGPQFAFLSTQKPDSVMLAEGSEIMVRPQATIKSL